MCAFYVSPGVYTREKDISTIVPALATTIGALVGYSPKGSLDITLITNRQQFIAEYGEPITGNYFHYSALAFLEKASALYCRRVVNEALYSGVHVKQSDEATDNEAFGAGQLTAVFYDESGVEGELISVLAVNPGLWGDNVSIIIKNVKDGTETEVTEQYTFEIDIYFTDSDGNSAKVENWKVSRKNKLDGSGVQMYLEDKINGYSEYIRVADNTSEVDTVLPKENSTAVSLGGGSDGSAVTAANIVGVEASKTGWYGFYNPDNVDVRILLGGGFLSTHSASDLATIHSALRTIAESRKDCIAILDVPYDEVDSVTDTTAFRDTTQNLNSSYVALYTPWVKIQDAYNDQIVEVPPSGYVGAQYAYNDYAAETWSAPAGFSRGMVNALGLSKVYTQGERDVLYAAGINPLQVFRGEGIVVWGQKTEQKKASALDRVNVRRLLIVVEKAISATLREFAFELNNELTRFRVTEVITSYLDDLSSRGAFQTEAGDDGYKVICDTTNNTPARIDRNELWVDIFVKPSRAAEFIQLQVILTVSGASFEELVSRGALFN